MRIRPFAVAAALTLFGLSSLASAKQPFKAPTPVFSKAVAFDVSKPARNLAPLSGLAAKAEAQGYLMKEIRAEHELVEVPDNGFAGDKAIQDEVSSSSAGPTPSIASPSLTFEGLSNQDNFNIYGFRVAPPDPVGAVGPNHYVEMVNLTFAVYDKAGTRLAGPSAIGDLWAGFAIPDCTDASGDPVVLYDRQADRWILSQFTTSGLANTTLPFYNCVAVSQTGDPTGAYYRYAFNTTDGGKFFFPDYPKYGVWNDSYLLTSRDFGPTVEYGISVYALEKEKMVAGDPSARAVKFFLDSDLVDLHLMGDGLLPADIDGRVPDNNGNNANHAAPIVGTMDSGFVYGAPFDGLNIFELMVRWNKVPDATLTLVSQLHVADFDSVYPCIGSRSCIPQPGIANNRWLDVLSIRQRPTYRLAFRDFGDYQTMVTNQSVEARDHQAGVRWYEIRRKNGVYSLFQQGTYAPNDGVHRWMGSVAMDKKGNIALGYSVSNATTVFPGIRYTGRLDGDPAGQMTLGEGTIINGTGAQVTVNNRWGDYTSMNVDPNDDCTFWYVNEYYQVTGVIGVNTVPWQTRIGSFKLPGCN
jgi:hypothetical protein